MTNVDDPTLAAARKVSPHHQPWLLTDSERDAYRRTAQASHLAKRASMLGEGKAPLHPINVPRLDPNTLMPQLTPNGLRSLSLFSGGGGLDLGFDRAGFEHVASWDVLEEGAVLGVEPLAFVAENVAAVGGPKFRPYLTERVLAPLGRRYQIFELEMRAEMVGVPQQRYVCERLALFDSKERQKRGRRWGQVHTSAWTSGLGVHRLSGTTRYISSATART